MGVNVLINNGKKYGGKYVAKKSFVDKKVISYGNDPVEVSKEAKKKGVNKPVIFYVPEKDLIQIYACL